MKTQNVSSKDFRNEYFNSNSSQPEQTSVEPKPKVPLNQTTTNNNNTETTCFSTPATKPVRKKNIKLN